MADWSRIEAQYRAGVQTLVELAAEHGITKSALNMRARRGGWKRRPTNGAFGVNAGSQVHDVHETRARTRENEVADEMSRRAQHVLALHREDLRRQRLTCARMVEELEAITANVPLLEEMIDQVAEHDVEGLAEGDGGGRREIEKWRATMKGACSLTQRATVMAQLAGALSTLQKLERKSYNLDLKIDPRDLSDEQIVRILNAQPDWR